MRNATNNKRSLFIQIENKFFFNDWLLECIDTMKGTNPGDNLL